MILIKQNRREEKGDKIIAGFEIKISGDGQTLTNEISALLKTLMESDDYRPLVRVAILANILGGISDMGKQEEENEPCNTDWKIN